MNLVQVNIHLLLLSACWMVGVTESSKMTDHSSPSCPSACHCLTTKEGLHKAVCSSTTALYKYSTKNKHHNINIIDISYSNITKINGDLDRFTEVVSLDLSYNSIKAINKIMPTSKKLVHLNLRNNVLRTFSASTIPSSVSSLDLQNNALRDIPSDLSLLSDLEHMQLKGNPLHCTCENLKTLDSLKKHGVLVDEVECVAPYKWKNQIWSSLKLSSVCSHNHNKESELKLDDEMMLGDQPQDVELISPLKTDQKMMKSIASSDLEEGDVVELDDEMVDKDEEEFIRVSTDKSSLNDPTEAPIFSDNSGSGEILRINVDESLPIGSGDHDPGSGSMMRSGRIFELTTEANEDYDEFEGSGDELITTSTTTEPFIVEIRRIIPNEPDSTTFGINHNVSVFQGETNWDEPSEADPEPVPDEPIKKEEVVTVAAIPNPNPNTDIGRRPTIKEDGGLLTDTEPPVRESTPNAKSTAGTYICVGLIAVLLVGLVGTAIIKSRIRKNKERGLQRQQRKDVEKADKEMVDMNKSLLGKPANPPNEDKKSNGNYELVPTHESFKTPENGKPDVKSMAVDVPIKPVESNERPPIQNGNSFKPDVTPKIEVEPVDEEIPKTLTIKPLKSGAPSPQKNTNGYPEPELQPYPPDYLPTFMPVDSGIVKIKLTETPKPKTPVLVTRSRSNAGDIIITPALGPNQPYKGTT